MKKGEAGITAALTAVLDVQGEIPWDTTDLLADSTSPPVAPIGLVLRSEETVRQMIDAMPEPLRTRKIEECEIYGTPLDEPYEIGWTVHYPRRESTFFRDMTFAQWVSYEAAKIPAGYLPVRLDVDEMRRRAFNSSGRDDAIRSALAEGVPVATLVSETGLSRARIYQIRDGRR